MQIAVTSQNRTSVTGHAGRCRKFWIYETRHAQVVRKRLLELPLAQSFHASAQDAPHPLDGVNVLISGGMGSGLWQRLKRKGILAVSTGETDPDRAVATWLDGSLKERPFQGQCPPHPGHGGY